MEFDQMMAPGLGTSYDLEEATKAFFRMLDEAIDDLEQGRVISEEQFWKEVDAL